MTDRRDEDDIAWVGWMLAVFGSYEAYQDALPRRLWERTANGWASVDRGCRDMDTTFRILRAGSALDRLTAAENAEKITLA